jgi:hypothetical protein
MGEDFIRKRQQNFKRRTDEATRFLGERDLFSGVQPRVKATISGLLLPGAEVSVGVPLVEIAESFARSPRLRIILGDGTKRVVELDGESAIQLSRAEQQKRLPPSEGSEGTKR